MLWKPLHLITLIWMYQVLFERFMSFKAYIINWAKTICNTLSMKGCDYFVTVAVDNLGPLIDILYNELEYFIIISCDVGTLWDL